MAQKQSSYRKLVASFVGADASAHQEDNFPGALEGPGELHVRGPNVFKKYINKPDATAEAFDATGWFRCECLPVNSTVHTVNSNQQELRFLRREDEGASTVVPLTC